MKHKLTPQAHSQIKQLALTLPELQKWEGGKPMFRKITKVVDSTYKVKNGKPVIDTNWNIGTEPVLINHEVHMIEEFKKGNMVKVMQYCAGVNLIVKKFNEKENERKAQTTAVGAES